MNNLEQIVTTTLKIAREAFVLDMEATEKFELLLRRELMQKYCSTPMITLPYNPSGTTTGVFTSPPNMSRTQLNG
jgi:hypothetical protein